MQLSYGFNMNPASAGTLYDLSPMTIDSYVAEGTVGLGFGVIAGTDPQNQATVPVATFSSGFKGIALVQAKEQDYATGSVLYNDKDTVPVLRKGRAWAPFTGGAITAEGQAFLIFTGADAGKWAAAAGTNAVAVPGAKFFTSNSNTSGLVVVELS